MRDRGDRYGPIEWAQSLSERNDINMIVIRLPRRTATSRHMYIAQCQDTHHAQTQIRFTTNADWAPDGRQPVVSLPEGCFHRYPPSVHACLCFVSVHQMALPLPTVGIHTNATYYSFTDPKGMKGWVGLVGWPIADGLPTKVVSHQLCVERGTRKFIGHRPTFYPLKQKKQEFLQCLAVLWANLVTFDFK